MSALLGITVLGAWLGVMAQERRTAWPPPPVMPPEETQTAEAASSAETQSVDHLPVAAQPESGVIHADYARAPDQGELIVPVSGEAPSAQPVKLPAEVPAQATKLPATGLVDSPPPNLTPPPSLTPAPEVTSPPQVTPAEVTPPNVRPPNVTPPEPMPRPPLPTIITPDDSRAVPLPEVLKQAPTKATAQTPTPAPLPEVVPPVAETQAPTPAPAPRPWSAPVPPSKTPSPSIVVAPELPPLPELITVPAPVVSVTPTAPPAPTSIPPAAPKLETKHSPPAGIQQPAPMTPSSPTAPATAPGAAPMSPASKTEQTPPAPQRPPAFLLVKPRRLPQAPSAPTAVALPAVPTGVTPREAVSPPALAPPALPPPALPGERVLASSASLIKVEKRGPATLKQGMNASYQIVVRNYGSRASGPVRVEDELPPAARLRGGEPAPAHVGDKVVWNLDNLEAGAEKVLLLDLLAVDSGEFTSRTTVFVPAASTTSKTRINQSPVAASSDGVLGIEILNPPTASVGQEVPFEVVATNRGKLWLTELVLHVKLDSGLRHPAGAEIEADVGNLDPGVTKTFRVPLTAVRVGRQQITAKISAAGNITATARAAVNVAPPGLSVRLPASTRLWLDRETDLRIDVGNHSEQPTRNVTVSSALPEHVDFVAASDRGIYQASARTVQWLLDIVPPWETRSLSVRVQPRKPGELAQEVVARAEALPEARAQSILQVEAHSDLKVSVTPRDNPLEVGRDTIYEVRVQNHGDAPATNVQLKLTMPLGLTPGFAQGPSGHRVENRIVTFDPVPRLPPRTQAVFHLGATAQAEGDWRVRVQVRSDQDRQPLVREVATMAYRE